MHDAEVVVVGLGTIGSATLYHLARRGVAAIGLEQYRLGHAFGSSHGHSRAFRIFYHDPLYVEMARASIPLWRELENRSGQQLLTLKGSLIFAQEGNPAFNQNVQVMQSVQQPYQLLTAAEVNGRFPVLQIPENSIACFTPQAGFINATRSVQAHLSQARQLGATVQEQVQLSELDLDGPRPVLHTSNGQYRCERLVLTPGPWATSILAQLALPLQVTRQQKFYFQPRRPAAYQPEHLPVFADDDRSYYGFPCTGPGLKVADDNDGEMVSPDKIDRALDLQKRDELQTWLEMIMPAIDISYVEGSTCMYTVTPDRDFLIGSHPKNQNVLVGAGFSGHGFKFSTLVGHILAELATDGTTSHPIERFRLDRFD